MATSVKDHERFGLPYADPQNPHGNPKDRFP